MSPTGHEHQDLGGCDLPPGMAPKLRSCLKRPRSMSHVDRTDPCQDARPRQNQRLYRAMMSPTAEIPWQAGARFDAPSSECVIGRCGATRVCCTAAWSREGRSCWSSPMVRPRSGPSARHCCATPPGASRPTRSRGRRKARGVQLRFLQRGLGSHRAGRETVPTRARQTTQFRSVEPTGTASGAALTLPHAVLSAWALRSAPEPTRSSAPRPHTSACTHLSHSLPPPCSWG